MKQKLTYIFLALVMFTRAQFDSARFMKAFHAAKSIDKVKIAAAYSYGELQPLYHLIQDTLQQIKQQVTASGISTAKKNAAYMLFDKLQFDKWMHEQNYREAILVAENALWHHAGNIDDSLRCFRMLKNANVRINNYNKAFEYEFMLQDYWPRKKDTALNDYGFAASSMYYMLGLKSEAIKHRRIEYTKKKQKHNVDDLVAFYNDMGVFYDPKINPDSSAYYFSKAKDLLASIPPDPKRSTFYTFYRGLVDGNLALCYMEKKNYEQAIPLLKHDLWSSMRTRHFQSAYNACLPLAECYLGMQDVSMAKRYLDTCTLMLPKAQPTKENRLDMLRTSAKYFEAIGDYKSASVAYARHHQLSDSLEISEKETKLISQGVALEIERRALEFSEKELLRKQLMAQSKNDDLFRIYIILGFAVAIFIIVLLVVNNRSFKKRESQLSYKNEQIQVQHAQIEHTLKEKEALIKEIHHRVKNNLQIINSMLNLQIGKIEDEKTETILFEARQRINAIALTHQMLYQRSTISSINMAEYVETLVHQIEAAMSQSNITTIVQISPTDEKLTIDGAVPLGLVINELLTNAYKHAFPTGKSGHITVSLTENPQSFTVSVTDNGKGLPEGLNYYESKTLGMELVFILVEQLESQLIIKTEPDRGTTFSFEIKKQKQSAA